METQTSEEPKAAPFAAEPLLQMLKPILRRPRPSTKLSKSFRFYLTHAMAEQARVVYDKLAKLKPGAAKLAAVLQEIEAAEAGSKQPEVVEEVSVEQAFEVASTPELESAYAADFKSEPHLFPIQPRHQWKTSSCRSVRLCPKHSLQPSNTLSRRRACRRAG